MQVDPTLMNVGDGATVSRGISAPNKASATMVGNPPQTLPLEFRGDVTLSHQNKTTPGTDCRAARACPDSSSYNHRPEPSPHPNNAHISGSAPTGSEKRADKRPEVSKVTTDGPGVFPHPQWINVKKGSQDDSVKKPHPQKQPAPSTPSGLQCSAVFQPAPPVTFLPPNSISSSLCKITLPPALGQIAALREAAAGQFQKESPPQSSADAVTPVLRTYPYPVSVGRIPAAEKKVGTSTSKLISNNSSHNKKNTKPAGEHKSPASEVTSPAIALPTQHPSLTSAAPTCYTLSPTAAICRGSALASIPCQNRLLNHVEQSNSADKATTGSLKTKAPSASEELAVCSVEPRDVPLDLSAKSKRPKCVNDSPVTTTQPNNNDSSQRDFLKSKRSHSANYNSAGQYPILPNTHRNGSHQTQVTGSHNHQLTENKPAWGKGSSQDSMKNIPGTYVGVASPILASTLRSKDGNGTFADEFQSFAKQEFISIVDQGEQLASRGKTPSSLMKSSQQAHSVKLVKNSSPVATKTCPSKGALTAALSSSANAQIRHRSGPGRATVLSPAWQHQAFSVKGKTTHGSPKAKGAPVTDGSKFQSSHHSPSKADVEKKWERIKSPLSNLASIVKHQALETSALTGEPVPSGKADPPTGGQDSQSKQMSTFKYSPYWSVKKWAGVPPPGDSTQTLKRYEKVTASGPLEINSKSNTLQASSKPPGQPQLLTSNPATNGNRMESKLAQVLEGVTPKSEIGASDTLIDQFKGKVGSFPSDQCAGGSEKKTDGTKRESPTKAKAAVKQKKSSRKSSTSSSKKAKGRKNEENSPIKGSSLKLKKKCSPEQLSPSAQKVPPMSKETPGVKISPSQTEIPANNKPGPDSGNPPRSSETPASLSSTTPYRKESDAAESYFPRLRRGRRRTDEARLDLWGFATPSPPPPPVPPPPPASQPSPLTPARRPRGRPRSTSLFEKDVQGKSASAETPTSKKRRRCRSRKYQSEDYITEKVEGGEHLDESDSERKSSGTLADPLMDQCPSPTGSSPDPAPRRPSFTRSGSVRYKESEGSPERSDKPSGKRKFKSKHLSSHGDQKVKTKRSSLGKRGASLPLDDVVPDVKRTPSPPPTPKVLPSSPSTKRGSSGRSSDSESPPKRPVPPEVRRLIVNKNAGETLLQRAARLGYQDVVQYCLEKDIREVNRRDNAGYTALHEASSRGWTQIVQMLLKHGADVNCSAQDGTRPLHDAVASDNLPIVWLLLNHGADPTLATYSGHTPVMLAHSTSMKSFLTEYFTDLDGHKEQDSSLHWEFYSSSLFETNQEPCWDFLLSEHNQDLEENGAKAEPDPDKDCLLFELSSEPLLPCYHVQVSLTQGFCNWFLLTDVLKRLKMSARIFRARYPHLEVVSLMCTELWSQVSVSQVSSALATPHRDKKKKKEEEEEGEEMDKEEEEEEEGGLVDLVRCVPELQRLLGSSIHFLQDDEEEEEEEEEESGKRTSNLRLF